MNEFVTKEENICLECFKILKPYMKKCTFKKDEILWNESDSGNIAIFLNEGFCKIFKTLPNGSELSLFIFGPDKFFGFLPLFEDSHYPAGAKALTDISTYIIDKKNLVNLINNNSKIAIYIIKSLTATLKTSLWATERFATKQPIYKVASAFYLLNFETKSKYNIITLPISSKDYAEMLGITPETFSRTISKLRDDKIIKKLEKNVFQIIDLEKLKQFSSNLSF